MDKGRKVKIAFNGSLWMLLAVNTTLTRVTPSGLLGQPTFFPFLSWPGPKRIWLGLVLASSLSAFAAGVLLNFHLPALLSVKLNKCTKTAIGFCFRLESVLIHSV
jgi:hypothetical protein